MNVPMAEHWLTGRFARIGLQVPDGGIFEPVPVTWSIMLGEGNTLKGPGTPSKISVDFIPSEFSQVGPFEWPLGFAGEPI